MWLGASLPAAQPISLIHLAGRSELTPAIRRKAPVVLHLTLFP